jgi:hypothetical protein
MTKRPVLLWNFDKVDEDIFPPHLDGLVQSVSDSPVKVPLELKAVATTECDLNEDTVICSMNPKIVAGKWHLLHRMLADDLKPIVIRNIQDSHQ